MTETTNDRAQPLVGFRTNEEWKDVLAQVATMIENLEQVEDPEIRHKIFATLQAIDAVHREALHRLVRLFKEGVLEQVVTDPAIHTLMGMYDLLPTNATADGMVVDFLTAEERSAGARRSTTNPVQTGTSARAPPGLAPTALAHTALAHTDCQPHWARVPLARPMEDGEAVIFEAEEGSVVVARVDSTLYAVGAVCPTHTAVMVGGVMKGLSWLCPHGPGCVYDIRNGSRLGGGPGVTAHPVRAADGGGLQVGFGIPFEPKLPAF